MGETSLGESEIQMKQLSSQTSQAYLQPGACLLTFPLLLCPSDRMPLSDRWHSLVLFLINTHLVVPHSAICCWLQSSLPSDKDPKSCYTISGLEFGLVRQCAQVEGELGQAEYLLWEDSSGREVPVKSSSGVAPSILLYSSCLEKGMMTLL